MRKILFLGYNSKKTKLIYFLKRKIIKFLFIEIKNLILKRIKNFDNIISFGYKKIIDKKIISLLNKPVINLSYFVFTFYNRGSHPNYWSFVNDTPKVRDYT